MESYNFYVNDVSLISSAKFSARRTVEVSADMLETGLAPFEPANLQHLIRLFGGSAGASPSALTPAGVS
jgi:hypothetical protein